MIYQTINPLLKHLSCAGLLFILLLLSGCQTLNLKRDGYSLADQQHWQMKARVAIRTPEDNVSATLDWQKQGKTFDFHLYGTFGVTYAHLIQQTDQAILQLPDDQTYYHQDAQQLLYQSLGWDFPIEALTHWIKGLPSYHSGELITRNEQGQISEALLNDWHVSFSKYQDYSGYSLPRIIVAKHPQMTLKLVVKDWTFLPEMSQQKLPKSKLTHKESYSSSLPPILTP